MGQFPVSSLAFGINSDFHLFIYFKDSSIWAQNTCCRTEKNNRNLGDKWSFARLFTRLASEKQHWSGQSATPYKSGKVLWQRGQSPEPETPLTKGCELCSDPTAAVQAPFMWGPQHPMRGYQNLALGAREPTGNHDSHPPNAFFLLNANTRVLEIILANNQNGIQSPHLCYD